MKSKWINRSVAGVLLAMAVSCSNRDNSIRIAVAGPLTGDFAEYGTGFKNGVELMADQWNSKGGVLGKPIEVVSFDDRNSGEEAASIAERIASDSSISAVVGHFASGVSMAASPTYQEAGVVEISPSASHPDYSSGGDYIFRNNTLVEVEAEETLQIAQNIFKTRNLGILSVKTDWGTTTADILINNLLKKHPSIQMVAHEEILDGTIDFSPVVTAFNRVAPDTIIVVGMYNILGPFASQYKAVEADINLIGFSNAYSEQLIELTREAAEGICLPAIFFHNDSDAKVTEFVTLYSERYSSIPSSLTAQAYDSMGILLQAISNVESAERQKIKEELYRMQYDGISGETQFNEKGDAEKSFNWLMIQNGQFEVVSR